MCRRGPRFASSVTHNLVVTYNDLFILFLDSWTIISAVPEFQRINCCINAFKYRGICTGLMTCKYFESINPYSKPIFRDTSFTWETVVKANFFVSEVLLTIRFPSVLTKRKDTVGYRKYWYFYIMSHIAIVSIA